jgi:hypothetical protein
LHERYRAERIEIPHPVRMLIVKEPSPAVNGSRQAAEQSR